MQSRIAIAAVSQQLPPRTLIVVTMGLDHLTGDERDLVRRCVEAATEGPFFPEWEFSTLFGLTRDQVRSVSSSWQAIQVEDEVASQAINNCLANLLGYPHGEQQAWDALIAASRDEVARVFEKWRAKRTAHGV